MKNSKLSLDSTEKSSSSDEHERVYPVDLLKYNFDNTPKHFGSHATFPNRLTINQIPRSKSPNRLSLGYHSAGIPKPDPITLKNAAAPYLSKFDQNIEANE